MIVNHLSSSTPGAPSVTVTVGVFTAVQYVDHEQHSLFMKRSPSLPTSPSFSALSRTFLLGEVGLGQGTLGISQQLDSE